MLMNPINIHAKKHGFDNSMMLHRTSNNAQRILYKKQIDLAKPI